MPQPARVPDALPDAGVAGRSSAARSDAGSAAAQGATPEILPSTVVKAFVAPAVDAPIAAWAGPRREPGAPPRAADEAKARPAAQVGRAAEGAPAPVAPIEAAAAIPTAAAVSERTKAAQVPNDAVVEALPGRDRMRRPARNAPKTENEPAAAIEAATTPVVVAPPAPVVPVPVLPLPMGLAPVTPARPERRKDEGAAAPIAASEPGSERRAPAGEAAPSAAPNTHVAGFAPVDDRRPLPARLDGQGGGPRVAGDAMTAPPLPAEAAPLVARMIEDPGLQVAVLTQAAHFKVEGEDGESLALHLRVRDGNAEIRIGGSMAPMFEARLPEVQAALAGEGLALGRFDLEHQGGGNQHREPAPSPEERPAPPAAAPYRPAGRAAEPVQVRDEDGHIHVTA